MFCPTGYTPFSVLFSEATNNHFEEAEKYVAGRFGNPAGLATFRGGGQTIFLDIYFVHNPFIALEDSLSGDSISCQFEEFDYERGVEVLNQKALGHQNIEMLVQPSETIVAFYYSKPEYASNHHKWPFDGEHSEKKLMYNRGHLNKAYGEIRLKAFFKKLDLLIHSA